MLLELRIHDFAIIDELSLEFEDGLVTLTGETGAGKSIIIDAVETILGGRTDVTMIRSNSDTAIIEGTFSLSNEENSPIKNILLRDELYDSENTIILSREIRRNGRNIARINGRITTVSKLREIGEYLVDIHGQSEHLTLLKTRFHLTLLDRYTATLSGSDIANLLNNYKNTYRKLKAVEDEIKQLQEVEKDSARQEDLLRYQINEIESANLVPGEKETLLEERKRLANAEQLASFAQDALFILEEGSAEIPSAIDQFGQVVDTLTRLSAIDEAQKNLSTEAETIFETTSELTRSLREYIERIEFNPKRLNQVEDRLFLIQNLIKKYGSDIPEIINFLLKAKDQLNAITHSEERLEELKIQKESLKSEIATLGQQLSEERKIAARKLETAIEHELTDMHMNKARFSVAFIKTPDDDGVLLNDGNKYAYYSNGFEKVEFLIETNPGEGFKPLVKIASGGETSRLMLSLKYVLAEADEIPTLIFDEIDQGIGGRVGASIGKKLQKLGQNHQVLCVTHLPQLAAYGNQHFRVQKTFENNRTRTHAKALSKDERIQELAQMMGTVSEGTLTSAKELIQFALQTED
jgi:DNA repair protein RecN (Recombination protein N)